MKPYDKSNSFMQRVTRRVSEFLPSTTWMNVLLGESQTDNDLSPAENDDQPPVKKLCTSINTFTNVHNRLDPNSADNHRSSHVNVPLPEISAVTCIPSTSRQSSKFSSPSNSPSSHDIGIRSSLKRKSDAVDLSNTTRPSQKALAFNFASSTPAVAAANKQPMVVTHSSRSLHSDNQCVSNDFLTQSSTTKLLKQRENESPSLLRLRDTTVKHNVVPSFRWDTFVNYGELSERQKLFAQRSPLNCSQVMYGGRSASSNLSKILGHTPPIHKKTTIPISSSKNSEIRTTSLVLLDHISTKDKEIEENKFIIQPRVHSMHKADHKNVPIKIETTVNIVDDVTPEKKEEKSSNTSSVYSGRDSSRKLRANISRKARGLQCETLEMPDKFDLPNVSLSVPVLPSINLSKPNNTNSEDSEFTFNQPLTLEQFSLQIAEKSFRKKQNGESILKKTLNTNSNANNEDQHSNYAASSPSVNVFTNQATKEETKKKVTSSNDIKVANSNNKNVSELLKFEVTSKSTLETIKSPDFSLEPTKPTNTFFGNSLQLLKTTEENQQQSVELKKWSCDTCWVVNDGNKLNCVACQTSKPDKSQKPLNVSKSNTLTPSESCLVSNKNEIDKCVAYQTQTPETKKTTDECSNWTCNDCWVKNKYDSNSCISCGAVKPGSAPEKKPQFSTQFNFGLNNNTFEKSGGNQFKFGFGSEVEQSSSQFKFGNPAALTNPEDSKSDVSKINFKFGEVDAKSNQVFGTFKFGSDNATKEPEQNVNAGQPLGQFKFGFEKKTDQPEGQLKYGFEKKTDQPEGQFKFGFEKKTDQPEDQFKSGLNSTRSVPISKFNFGSHSVETEKSIQQNCTTDSSKVTISTNDSLNVNNANEISAKLAETQSMGGQLQLGDTKLIKKSIPLFTFGSVKTNCNDSNTLSSNGNNNEDVKEKCVLDSKDIIEMINCGITQTNQSGIGSTNTNQMVNGHSHPKDDQKPGLFKTPQLFSFGSVAKQDQNLPDNQISHNPFVFGSVSNGNKSFVTPSSANSFPSAAPVFGTNISMFGNGPTSTSSTPQFSFGSVSPVGFLSKTIKDNGKPSIQNSFTSTTSVSFSFNAQSQPVFSTANTAGLFTKSVVQDNDKAKSVSNNLFNQQSNTKTSVKLDPNAPIAINFTGGATTQFTAKPETTEPPAKRKILKPVRKIR